MFPAADKCLRRLEGVTIFRTGDVCRERELIHLTGYLWVEGSHPQVWRLSTEGVSSPIPAVKRGSPQRLEGL